MMQNAMLTLVNDSNGSNSSGGLTAALCALMLYNREQLVCESAFHNGNVKRKLNE